MSCHGGKRSDYKLHEDHRDNPGGCIALVADGGFRVQRGIRRPNREPANG